MTTFKTAQAKTMRAAGDARATGQLSKTAYKAIADGRVTKTDAKNAKKILARAEGLLKDISREGASSRQLGLAKREVKIADKLLDSIEDQLDAQDTAPSRPRTGGGKGSTRPRRPARRTVLRPRTSSGKGGGVSRPGGK